MYKPVIGLEIHVQVKTKSKMFCKCSTDYFEKKPNINVCPVCLGLPGALPIPNKLALEKTIKLAIALNCEIPEISKFDRKNYFYPDLPKGYQISQYDIPIGQNGFVEIEINGDSRRVRIQRVHIEEDTAKSIHINESSLIDYNKSGIPLIEIVTYPDFESVDEVIAFAKRLKQILKYNDISDTEMQKGQLRFELNISLLGENTIVNDKGLPNYKVEVKNIGSISVLEKVANFEIQRQKHLQEKNIKIKSETRGLKDMSGETVFQRYKEEAEDYRYFPEPDIPPFSITKEWILQIKSTMAEQPVERKHRYLKLGLEGEQADVFVDDTEKGDWFDSALKNIQQDLKQQSNFIQPKELAKWIIGEISGLIEKKSINTINNLPFSQKWLIDLLQIYYDKKITGNVVKKILEEEINQKSKNWDYKSTKDPFKLVSERGYLQIEDENFIRETVDKVINENKKIVQDINKNPNAIKSLIGYGMKISQGKINPKILESEIKKSLKIE